MQAKPWQYYKKMILFDKRSMEAMPVCVRNYTVNDIPELIEIQRESFPPPFPVELWWNEQQLHSHIERFPQGAICVEAEGQLAASVTGLMLRTDETARGHTWAEATDNGYIRNHRPDGDTLYIVDISVRPRFRSLGLGKWLMQGMYELVVQLGLQRLLGGGRLSGYGAVAEEMEPEQYLQEVVAGRRHDPVISFLLRCGRLPIAIVPNYLEDEESRNYAVLMEWRNPFAAKNGGL